MLSGYLVGDRALVARVQKVGPAVIEAMARTVDMLGISLQRRVVAGYLSGPRPIHLGRVTGRLASSIARGAPETSSRFERSGDVATSYVGTNVPYGKTWETTGLAARIIRPVRAKALRFEIGGEVFFRKSVQQKAKAPRPFLAPALEDMRPQIVAEIQKAVTAAAQEALRA